MAVDGFLDAAFDGWTDLLDGNAATTASYMFQCMGPSPVLVRIQAAQPASTVFDGAEYASGVGEGFPTQVALTSGSSVWIRSRSRVATAQVKRASTDT